MVVVAAGCGATGEGATTGAAGNGLLAGATLAAGAAAASAGCGEAAEVAGLSCETRLESWHAAFKKVSRSIASQPILFMRLSCFGV
jgi:hypothetical protein